MVGQNALDEPPAAVRDVGDQEILLRREAHARAQRLDDATNGAAQPPVTIVSDAPVLDEQAQERAPALLRVPPKVIGDARDVDVGGRCEPATQQPLDLLAEPVEPLFIQEVLEPGVPPIAAVAVIALNLDDGFANLHSLPEPDESQRVGEPRIGVFLAVRLPHPATYEDVETKELTAFLDYEEAEVVRVDVAAIIVGKRERHLALSPPVTGPVDLLRLPLPA